MLARTVVVACLLSLAACGGTEQPTGPDVLVGFVVDSLSGMPRPGVRVRLYRLWPTVTDSTDAASDGSYLLHAGRPGEYTVDVPSSAASKAYLTTVMIDGTTHLDIRLQPPDGPY